MSRSTLSIIAALAVVVVAFVAWGVFRSAPPATAPAGDSPPAAEPARVAVPNERPRAVPTAAVAPVLSAEEKLAAIAKSKATLDAAATFRHQARFPPTSRRIEDNLDPIVHTRTVSERLSSPGQGRKPTLVVFSSSLSYEAPNPIILYAKFIKEYPNDWAPRADAEIAGELVNAAGRVVAQVDLNDEGQERDLEAGDGVFTAILTPPEKDLRRWNGLIRVKIYGETVDGDRRSAKTRFYYGVPSAKLTGYYRDELVNGNLQVEAEVEVKEIGEYRLEATLTGSQGLLAWAVSTVQLEPGVTFIPLTFFGLALREWNEPGPYRLSSIALANVTYKPPQLNDAISTQYDTAPYKPEDFSSERFNDPKLLEKADRYEARAHGEATRGQ